MNLKNIYTAIVMAIAFFFTSCTDSTGEAKSNELPTRFKVDIPNSISHSSSSRSISENEDTILGEDIYEHMGTFIYVGEQSAEIVQDIIRAISRHNIEETMTFSYESDEDDRTKDVVVEENVSFEGVDYAMKLTLSDAGRASEDDEGKAIQVFWNTNPVEGVAILKPSNININDTEDADAIFKIEYSEAGNLGYEKHMIVSIADLSVESPLVDPYSMSDLKMFVGKSGEIVDVYGNSNHPNASFFTQESGFNWAFVASAHEESDIAIAEVGLPSSQEESSERSVLLNENSIKNVFTNQISATWPNLPQAEIDAYLANTDGPAYFDDQGFIAAGVSPNGQYVDLTSRITSLTPYVPKSIANLIIDFH